MNYLLAICIPLVGGFIGGRFISGSQPQGSGDNFPNGSSTEQSASTPYQTERSRESGSGTNFPRSSSSQRTHPSGSAGSLFDQSLEKITRLQDFTDEEFIKEAANLESLTEQRFDNTMLFTVWAKKSPRAALEFLNTSSPFGSTHTAHAQSVIYATLVQEDPQNALAILAEFNDIAGTRSSDLSRDLATITRVWERIDTDACFEWLSNLKSPAKGHALSKYISNKADDDLAGVLVQIKKLPANQYESALFSAAKAMGKQLKWKEIETQLSEFSGKSQGRMQANILSAYAEQNPYEASDLIFDLNISPTSQRSIISKIISKIGSESPADSLDWLLSNTKHDRYQSALAGKVFNPWITKDPATAGEWLLTQPNDAASQKMVARLMRDTKTSAAMKTKISERFGIESP